MKKTIFLFALAVLVSFSAMGNGRLVNKSLGDKDEPFVEKMRQSTLVVVMLEENTDYIAKLTKKGKNDMAATYSASIKAYNDNMRAMVPQCLKIGTSVIYKTAPEIGAMSTEERNSYSYLLYNKSTDYGARGANMYGCDFFNDNAKDVSRNIEDYENFIQFECLSDKDKPNEYRILTVYAPGNKKHQSSGQLTQNLIDIVPTQGDLKVCLLAIQGQYDFMIKNENMTKDQQKEMVAQAKQNQQNLAPYYDTIKHKTLLICQQDVDKDLPVDHIKACYPFSYKVVSKDDFDKAILSNDGRYCVLLITPFMKIPGAYGAVTVASVKYMHSIIDAGSGNTLYAGLSGHVAIGASGMGGYETITEKNLKQLTNELQNPGK